jgi:hypothetical protein
MDVATVFLNANVESDIYMEQPEGHNISGPGSIGLVFHMKKSLYGIYEEPKSRTALFTS